MKEPNLSASRIASDEHGFPPLPADARRALPATAAGAPPRTIEVLVVWQDRVLDTRHFARDGVVHIGSHEGCELSLPFLLSGVRRRPLFEQRDGRTRVHIAAGQRARVRASGGERRERRWSEGAGALDLLAGEEVEIDLGSSIVVRLRHVERAPRVLLPPFLNRLSRAQIALAVLGLNLAGLLAWVLATTPLPQATPQEATPPRIAILLPESPPAVTDAPPLAPPTPSAVPPRLPLQREARSDDAPKERGRHRRPPERAGGRAREATTSRRDFFASMASAFGPGERLSGSLVKESARAGRSGGEPGGGARVGGPRLKNTGDNETATVGDLSLGDANRLESHEGGESSLSFRRQGTSVTVPAGEAEMGLPASVDREAVRAVVVRNTGAIRACFERVLRVEGNDHGKVRMRWTVGARGHVTAAAVAGSEFKSKDLHSCLTRQVQGWVFPVPPESATYTVEFPFVFQAR